MEYRTEGERSGLIKGLAMIVGAAFALAGVAGFFVTGFENFAQPTDKKLLIFEVNPLHNIVHLLIGIAGLLMARRLSSARLFGWLLAGGYGLTFIHGLFVANQDTSANFLSINTADNWLHLFSAAAGLVIALIPRDRGGFRENRFIDFRDSGNQ